MFRTNEFVLQQHPLRIQFPPSDPYMMLGLALVASRACSFWIVAGTYVIACLLLQSVPAARREQSSALLVIIIIIILIVLKL